MNYLTTGTAANQLGMKYHTLCRALRKHKDLPGVARAGVNAVFDPAKIDELRERFVQLGVIRPELAAAA